MLRDEYFMNIYTGEMLPGREAIRQFYAVEKHSALESWADEWKPTGEYCESTIPAPDFAAAVVKF